MSEIKLHHNDIAYDIEQKIDGVTYVESEGSDSIRVDFGQQSIWFEKYSEGIIDVRGALSTKNFNIIKKYLQQYGNKVQNDIKCFKL